MQKEKKVCLAVIPHRNGSYKNIYNKAAFIKYMERRRGIEEAFILLAGGSLMSAKVDAIKEMEWILESA